MRFTHRSRVPNDLKRFVEFQSGDLENRIAFVIDRLVLLPVNDHVIVVWTGPCDGDSGRSVLDDQFGRTVNGGLARAAFKSGLNLILAVFQIDGGSRVDVISRDRIGNNDLVVIPVSVGAD